MGVVSLLVVREFGLAVGLSPEGQVSTGELRLLEKASRRVGPTRTSHMGILVLVGLAVLLIGEVHVGVFVVIRDSEVDVVRSSRSSSRGLVVISEIIITLSSRLETSMPIRRGGFVGSPSKTLTLEVAVLGHHTWEVHVRRLVGI